MVEQVNTGGLKRFVYTKNETYRVNNEGTYRINEAYKKARKRKLKNRIIKIGIAILILILSIIYFLQK